MVSNITIDFDKHSEYETEMNGIKKSLSQFSNYKKIASAIGKIYPQEIVAGLIGCIIIESKTDHTIINKKEYEGRALMVGIVEKDLFNGHSGNPSHS